MFEPGHERFSFLPFLTPETTHFHPHVGGAVSKDNNDLLLQRKITHKTSSTDKLDFVFSPVCDRRTNRQNTNQGNQPPNTAGCRLKLLRGGEKKAPLITYRTGCCQVTLQETVSSVQFHPTTTKANQAKKKKWRVMRETLKSLYHCG